MATNKATPEQDNECKKVINEIDYYKLLNIEKNSSQEEIRRAYKKVIIINKSYFNQLFFHFSSSKII
jgi:hypothetical protein